MPTPAQRFPQSKSHQPAINSAAVNADKQFIAVASSVQGKKIINSAQAKD